MTLWITKPGDSKPSATLTFSVYAVALVLIKFLLNGVDIEVLGKTIHFGTIDPAMIAAILTPTLGAHTLKKFTGNSSTPTTDTKEV